MSELEGTSADGFWIDEGREWEYYLVRWYLRRVSLFKYSEIVTQQRSLVPASATRLWYTLLLAARMSGGIINFDIQVLRRDNKSDPEEPGKF